MALIATLIVGALVYDITWLFGSDGRAAHRWPVCGAGAPPWRP
ncbi:hypothetical protein [Streptomyces sp. NPDC002573]